MTKERLNYLLDRYLNNTATAAELAEYNAWYEEQGAKGLHLFEKEEEAKVYADELFNNIRNSIQYEEYQEEQARKKKVVVLYRWLSAAAVLVVVSSVLLFFNLRRPAQTVVASVVEKADSLIRVVNEGDEKKQLVLPDGSTAEVWGHTEVQYASSFGQSDRRVWLTGKGYFKVTKDSSRPFVVFSGEVSTTALGTSFTITAWAGQPQVNVELHTGKVVVQQVPADRKGTFAAVYLSPGEALLCDAAKGVTVLQQPAGKAAHLPARKPVALGARVGYTASFDQESLPAVLEAIAKGYQVQIRYDKQALTDRVFSGSIRATDSLEQVLSRIAALHNLTLQPITKGYIVTSHL